MIAWIKRLFGKKEAAPKRVTTEQWTKAARAINNLERNRTMARNVERVPMSKRATVRPREPVGQTYVNNLSHDDSNLLALAILSQSMIPSSPPPAHSEPAYEGSGGSFGGGGASSSWSDSSSSSSSYDSGSSSSDSGGGGSCSGSSD